MQVYIVMGVSGVGKTTIGKLLAQKLKLPFYDADDFHSPQNIVRMSKGVPLEDNDRKVWLNTLAKNIKIWHRTTGAVLACSALKEEYRKKLSSIPSENLTWVFLHAEYDLILQRLNARREHFFKPSLLRSQYDVLEIPESGIHINVQASKKEIIEEIMEKIHSQKQKSKIGIIGLGVMGKSLALNMASKDIQVSVYNRQVEKLEVDIAKNFALENKATHDFSWFDKLKPFLESLEPPRKILVMVSAGKPVDMVLKNLLPLLDQGDLIIDGGNSHYKDSIRREQALQKEKIHFIGAGISGGEEGAKKGPSIMPGGSREAYEEVGWLLEKIAAKDKNGNPCCSFIGPDGSGHFVKMVHNGIEYGEMQLIAEVYHFLRFHYNQGPLKIARLFEEWNREMNSFLLEISIDILQKKEDDVFLIDRILDAAKQKGTGGWSTIAALELGVPLDTITAAVMARNISGRKKERVRASEKYQIQKETTHEKTEFPSLFKAYKIASIINHATGFDLLSEASKVYEWDLNQSEIARIWTNGCIIRSGFMEQLVELLKENKYTHLLLHDDIISEINRNTGAIKNTIAKAIKAGIAVPVLSAAENYFLSFTSEVTSANMIQAQRDYFGAHTYERTDRPRGEFFHTQWKDPNS